MSNDRIISADEARRLLDGAGADARLLAAAPDLARTVVALEELVIALDPDLALALEERLATLDAEVARGIAERETLRRERDEARAVQEWRPAPSRDEVVAHHAAHAKGGTSWWVTIYPNEVESGRDPYVWYSRGDGSVWGCGVCGLASSEARWSPRDARLMPCAWPVVTS